MRRFVETCDAVAATAKKSEKIRLVSEYLKELSTEDAARATVFLTGRVFPQREERSLGVGGTQLVKLVTTLAGDEGADLVSAYCTHGDLGAMAEQILRKRAGERDISLKEIAAVFEQLPALRIVNQKNALLRTLLEKTSAQTLSEPENFQL